ncbi:hypothetical protein ARSEF4850_000194 [Beauveria asiatica]
MVYLTCREAGAGCGNMFVLVESVEAARWTDRGLNKWGDGSFAPAARQCRQDDENNRRTAIDDKKKASKRLRGPEMAAGFILGNAPAALVSMVGWWWCVERAKVWLALAGPERGEEFCRRLPPPVSRAAQLLCPLWALPDIGNGIVLSAKDKSIVLRGTERTVKKKLN